MNWHSHLLQAGDYRHASEESPEPADHCKKVEPWLSALFQAEHLNLLVGSGLTAAIADAAQVQHVDMSPAEFKCRFADAVTQAALQGAERLGRGQANIEDQARAVLDLIGGLRIFALGDDDTGNQESRRAAAAKLLLEWESELDRVLGSFLNKVLATERGIQAVLEDPRADESNQIRSLLGGFLLPFASRTATRERTHIFTINYDRLIEYGCDLLGLRVVDRFVGTLAPVFHSSRLGIDLHYNPPGIRGEPRYLEGVVRFTKLHGSIDWRSAAGPSGGVEVQRSAVPFGAAEDHPGIPQKPSEQLLIYPNASKDIETLEYPYAELFRDFAAAVCQPNAVIVTYGYGFGDDHVNRILRDMLSLPSTHLVIISYDAANGRLETFCKAVGREAQITLLVGSHFGELQTLVENYLPKPAIDRATWRMIELLNRRSRPVGDPWTVPKGRTSDGNDLA